MVSLFKDLRKLAFGVDQFTQVITGQRRRSSGSNTQEHGEDFDYRRGVSKDDYIEDSLKIDSNDVDKNENSETEEHDVNIEEGIWEEESEDYDGT